MRYDLIVLGSDPAGMATAVRGAEASLRTTLIAPPVDAFESGALLRETLGTLVPELAVDVLRGGRYQQACSSGLFTITDLRELLIGRVESHAAQLAEELQQAGVDVLTGYPRLLDEHHVEVAGEDCLQALRGDSIVIATGTRSSGRIDGEQHQAFISDIESVFCIDRIPGTLLVCGASPTGIGLAGLFAVVGSSVTVVDSRDLAGSDMADVDGLIDVAMAVGVNFRLGADVIGMDEMTAPGHAGRHGLRVQFDNGDRMLAERVLLAGDRVGRTETLGLENAGLICDDTGRLWCDHQQRTWQEHIYAAGDVVGFAPGLAEPDAQARRIVSTVAGTRRVPAPLGLKRDRSRSGRGAGTGHDWDGAVYT